MTGGTIPRKVVFDGLRKLAECESASEHIIKQHFPLVSVSSPCPDFPQDGFRPLCFIAAAERSQEHC